MPKSAAVAETPQLPELWLQWHPPRGLGEGVGRHPGPHHHPHPSWPLSTHLAPPEFFRWPPGAPAPCACPPPTPPPVGHHTPKGLNTSHKLQPRQAWITGPQETAGGLDGEVAHLPTSCRSKGTKEPEQRLAAQPAALPTAASHTGFTGLPRRRGQTWPQAINYKLVRGREGWRRRFHIPLQPQVEIPALSRMCPE